MDFRKADPTYVNFKPRTCMEAIDLFDRHRRLGLTADLYPECFVHCARALPDAEVDLFHRFIVNPDGDVAGPDGWSMFPGNVNQLVFALGPYADTVARTGGIVPEFVNPKYADAARTACVSQFRRRNWRKTVRRSRYGWRTKRTRKGCCAGNVIHARASSRGTPKCRTVMRITAGRRHAWSIQTAC